MYQEKSFLQNSKENFPFNDESMRNRQKNRSRNVVQANKKLLEQTANENTYIWHEFTQMYTRGYPVLNGVVRFHNQSLTYVKANQKTI